MRKLFIPMVICVLCYYSVAAQSDAATYFAKYMTALKYYQGDGLPVNQNKAFQLMKECSEQGQMPDAMLGLGLMYKLGNGTTKSDEEAFKWINKSSEKGNSKAHFALGKLYKEGAGINQDFAKAREAFEKSADSGDAAGQYMLGYMYNRGLGGEQNYRKAADLFKQSDSKGFSAAAHMLGVYYKNGYGVKKDISKANFFLNKAAEKGFKNARKEKNEATSEVDLQRDRQYQKHINEKNLSTKNVVQEKLNDNISGVWQGKQYTFDWSKQHILEEVNLALKINEDNGIFNGEWYEDGKLLLNFTGKIIDQIMLFDVAEFEVTDKYGEEGKMAFTQAKLELLTTHSKYLAGEVESYIPKFKEPGYPIYIVAEKIQTNIEQDSVTNKSAEAIPEEEVETLVNDEAINSKEQDAVISFIKKKEDQIKVYPNPITQGLTIDYTLDNPAKVSLSIFNEMGAIVLKKELPDSHSGQNSHYLEFNEIPGNYILIMQTGEQRYSKVIIKK